MLAWWVRGPRASGSEQRLAATVALFGVTGRPESNVGRIFRGPGVVVIVLDACVAADAVASPPKSVEAGSDVGATSAQPSSCTDGRSPWCVTVILESNEPSVTPQA